MQRITGKIGAAVMTVVAVVTLAASPAQAYSKACRGECTTGTVQANVSYQFIDVYVFMDDENGLWCSWVLRDASNNVVVASGKTYDETKKRVPGLYGRYKLFVSNYSCWGQIDNEN